MEKLSKKMVAKDDHDILADEHSWRDVQVLRSSTERGWLALFLTIVVTMTLLVLAKSGF